jgi:gliding motility-associated-like protein
MKTHNIPDGCNAHKAKNYISVIVLLLFCCHAYGQSTTQGKDFWISFGSNNANSADKISLQVRIVATNASKVKLTFTETGYTETISLAAGNVYTRNLSTTEKESVYLNGSGVSQKSLHVESDENVAVYAINLNEATTDATCILPVEAYGKSYYHLSYRYISDGSNSYDGHVIVAIEDNTSIYVNGVLVASLDKGDVYSRYFTDNNIRHTTSDKPVAYFTTNPCTEVYAPACDCLYEQLLPESLWGLSYMIPVTIRGKERIRVYASQDNTVVSHTGGIVVSGSLNLDKGEYVELEIDRDEAGCYIEADKPVAVASYLMGLRTPYLDYDKGDPAMAWIPSTDQSITEAIIAPFIASGSSILSEHHILIITPTAGKELTEMRIGNADYTPLSGGIWLDHLSGYSIYSMPLNNANMAYGFRNPTGLTILGYGLGNFESYYYLAGSALRRLDASIYINNIHYQDSEAQTFCNGNFEIKAVVLYNMHRNKAHLRWFIDDVEETDIEDKLQWSKSLSEGKHKISMIVKNEYGDLDTIRSSFVIARDIEIADTTVCRREREKVNLQINNTFEEFVYSWFYDANYTDTIASATSLETDILTADTVFYIEAASPGCTLRKTVTVSVNSLPELISKDTSICYNTTATPVASGSNAAVFRWYSDLNYTDTVAKTASFETDALTSNTMFYIEAVSDKGCISRDNIEITVNPLPQLIKEDLNICLGSMVEITASSPDDITFAWYRDNLYSNLISQDISLQTNVLENDTVFYIEAISDKNCKTRDSITITLTVPPVVVAMDDRFICYGEEVMLELLRFDGAISWNVSTETVKPASTQQYIVTASRPPCPDMTDSVTITVGDSLYLSPSELAIYKPGGDYTQQLTTNAESPVFSIIGGGLPSGLYLNTAGIISGLGDENDELLSTFTIQVEDVSGCKIKKDYALEKELSIPAAFSPNSDGINDFFMKGYKIIIFDRIGMEIFKGDDGWNGTHNGKPAPQDIYFYKLYYKNEKGNTVPKTGYVGIMNGMQRY